MLQTEELQTIRVHMDGGGGELGFAPDNYTGKNIIFVHVPSTNMDDVVLIT